MKLKTVPARAGVLWVRAGFRVFFRQPLLFGALFGLTGFAALLLVQLPIVGPVLALALMPAATLAFMLATRSALDGRPPQLAPLLAPWRDPLQRRRLVSLGFAYALAAIVTLWLVQALDGGRFDAALEAVAKGSATPETLQDANLGTGLALRLAVVSILSLVFWHAPALVYWGRMDVPKAVFASVVACLRSLGAFAVYGLTWFGITVAYAVLSQTVFLLLGSPQSATLALLPGAMMFSTVFYASLYFTFVDAFELDEPDATALA
ncbi:MAG TPA: BPSS1780 family membrane protein [Methylibium sp.]|nr:BPSS1780 family membrane protein [Methylibium sp.]